MLLIQSVDESIRKLMLNSHKSTDLHESMMSHWRYESEDTNGERHRLGNYQRVARHYMGYKMAIFFIFFFSWHGFSNGNLETS
ncbi:hypothetical protein POPTR_013G043250v4 [Populus trichocarpa]|uniref:Uncharacterized protein n=1 Tax=Populus trichocarpa TaxID=3694 RepID=A0ACC0S115_POPTR|nr:hypothetical protein POPTR_013G043250v4 [Populus trichocarpa]